MTLQRIAQILDDLFGIPRYRVELSDNLVTDWGLDDREIAAFETEFWSEFGTVPLGGRTVQDYANLVAE